jgi:uncharacterized membrane protein YqjE
MNSPVVIDPMQKSSSTPELVKQVLNDARELITLEARLAVQEARTEVLQIKQAAIVASIALALVLLSVGTLLLAVVLALGGTAIDALIVAAVLLVGAGVSAAYAYAVVPKKPLQKTRERLQADANQLKEHVA